jgi:hypothetical protein
MQDGAKTIHCIRGNGGMEEMKSGEWRILLLKEFETSLRRYELANNP